MNREEGNGIAAKRRRRREKWRFTKGENEHKLGKLFEYGMMRPIVNVAPQRMMACLRMFCVATIICAGSSASAQVIVPSPTGPDNGTGDRFRSLGVDGDGQVWILGKCLNGPCDNDEALFRFTGDGFETMRLVPLPNTEWAEARSISRDGQYIVGSSHGDGFVEPTLWSRRESLVPKSLGNILEFSTAKLQDVASTAAGPVIVGYYGFGTLLWTEGTGYQAWMTNSDYWPLSRSYAVSADGTRWAGQQYSRSGSNVTWLPFAGTESRLEILKTKGGSDGFASLISPNGEYVAGNIGGQPAIWTRKKVEFLSLGKDIAALQAVTDSGYAGGRGAGGGVIYDSRGRKLEFFENWWANNYPFAPLPAHVADVNDLYEYEAELYCLIKLEDRSRDYHTSALAIAPLKPARD